MRCATATGQLTELRSERVPRMECRRLDDMLHITWLASSVDYLRREVKPGCSECCEEWLGLEFCLLVGTITVNYDEATSRRCLDKRVRTVEDKDSRMEEDPGKSGNFNTA